MSRRSIFRWSVLAAFFFGIGFTYEYHLPQIEAWLLMKIEDLAARHSPVKVVPKKLRLTLFPLGVVLEDIHVTPKKGMDRTLAPTDIKELALGINIWALIRGEPRLSHVILRDSTITVFLRPEVFISKPGAKPFSLNKIRNIPIDEITLENMTIMGRLDPQALVFRVSNLDIDAVNLYNSLYLYMGSPSWQFKPAGPYPTLNWQGQFRGLLDSNELRISALKIKAEDSFVVASGLLNGDLTGGPPEQGRFNLRTHVSVADIANWVRVLPHPPKLPKMSGAVNLNAEIAYRGKAQPPALNLTFDTQALVVDQFHIGDITGEAVADSTNLKSGSILFKRGDGEISLKNLTATRKPKLQFSGDVDLKSVALQPLLEDLGVHHVPVKVDVNLSAPCKGEFDQHLNIQCEGNLSGENLEVRDGGSNKLIIKAKKFAATGKVNVTEQAVSYQAEATLGSQSKGRSQGTVDFDKGFQINFEGDNLDFADIDNLVNLKFQGATKLKGSTEGDGHRATVQIKAQTKNLWLEDFGIGDLTALVAYKTGHLTITGIDGQFGVSRYNGAIDIDLLKNSISMQNKLTFIDLKDLSEILSRHIPIPVALTGTGAGELKAWGPLDFEKLNYEITSQFFRGSVAGETFDSLHFNIDAKDGVAHTRRVQMMKANGQFEMRGLLSPNPWTIDSVLVGRNLRLEQSEIINQYNLDLQGQGDFNLTIRGPLKKPHVELNGRLSRVVIADQPQEDSSFRLIFSQNHLTGSGQFLGSKLQTEFIYPLEPNVPFALELKTNDWDFTNLFSMFSKSSGPMDFQTSLSMEAKLHSNDGGFWNSSGLIEIKQLKLRQGAETMQNNGPMMMVFNNGKAATDNFSIRSGENFLRLKAPALSRDQLNANLDGKMNLGMLALAMPFVTDLRGDLSLNVALKGSIDRPLLSGSAFVDKGYVKLRDFPHPFTNLHSDLLFNQQTLLINAFRSELGGGKLTADGHISFVSRDDVPVDVKGSFTNVSLNYPEEFKTRGSGDIAFKGQRFPYILALRYDITGGEVTSEFEAAPSTSTIKASPYLPKFIEQTNFEPFQLDMDITLKKPIPVSNSLLHALVQGHALGHGTPRTLLLNGTFSTLPGGKLFFRDSPFDIETAYVEYANYPPDNPRIYITATTHASEVVTDQQHFETPVAAAPGQAVPQNVPHQSETQYDINLLVQGRAKPSPQITLTSQPPLSQRDIVSLLALGMTPSALDQYGSNAPASSALGAALLQQPAAKKLKESLGVDMKVSTAPPTAADPTAAPMVTLSRQWTPNFSVSASSSFGQIETNSAKLEYKLNQGTSLIGSWEDRDQSTTFFEQENNAASSIFGLDLEYKFQFK